MSPTFHVAIVDADGDTVAEVDKTLYVRQRRDAAKTRDRAPARGRSPGRA